MIKALEITSIQLILWLTIALATLGVGTTAFGAQLDDPTVEGITVNTTPGTFTVTRNSGGGLGSRNGNITIMDANTSLETVYRTNRYKTDKNYTFSYTEAPSGFWDFSYTVSYNSGGITSDRISIDGTAQHTNPPGGTLFNFLKSISAEGSPPDGSKKTDTIDPTNVTHPPSSVDQYTGKLQGVVYNPWIFGRDLNPWTFTLNAGHDQAAALAFAGGDQFTHALAVNNLGQVVGDFANGSLPDGFNYQGYLRSTDGIYSSVNFPGATSTIARGVNDSGQIVGQYLIANSANGYLLSGGSFSTIDFPGAIDTTLFGINESGQIVGSFTDIGGLDHAFLFSGGVFTSIVCAGAVSSQAVGINNFGRIVGEYFDGSTFHGFQFSGGVCTPLDPPGSLSSAASGINDLGQIVGDYLDTSSNINGYLFNAGSFSTIDFPGVTDSAVRGINEAGELVGIYINDIGDEKGYLLTAGNFSTIEVPVPEPASLALLVTSLLVLGLIGGNRRRRQKVNALSVPRPHHTMSRLSR